MGFPGGLAAEESACSVGDLGWIPGLGRSEEEKGYPLQYSGLENSMDCMYSPWGRKESNTTEGLSLSRLFSQKLKVDRSIGFLPRTFPSCSVLDIFCLSFLTSLSNVIKTTKWIKMFEWRYLSSANVYWACRICNIWEHELYFNFKIFFSLWKERIPLLWK